MTSPTLESAAQALRARLDLGAVTAVRAGHLRLQPATVQDVAAALAWAHEEGIPAVPRGLETAGALAPPEGALLIDLAPLDRIEAPDPDAGTVTVQAGAAWGHVEAQLDAQDMALYTYPASRFSTVGGWVATGGLGINGFGYGPLRDWVAALTRVTSEGDIQHLTPDSPGFDACFGSQGRAGVIAEVTLRARRAPGFTHTHLFYFNTPRAQTLFVQHLIATRTYFAHLALYGPGHMAALNRLYTDAHPDRTPFYAERPAALIHVESEAEQQALEDALAHADFLVEEGPPYAAATMWHERFYPLAPLRHGPDLLAVPVLMPVETAADLLEDIALLAAYFGLRPAVMSDIVQTAPGSYRALVFPRLLCDASGRAYSFHRLAAHLVTYRAGLHGGRSYPNYPFRLDRLPSPALLKLADIFAAQLGRVAHMFQGASHLSASPPPRPRRLDSLTEAQLDTTVRACTGCGACVPVCPAWRLTRDETTTARTKLQIARRLLEGAPVAPEHAKAAFLCTGCGACVDVCETELPLLAAYASLEDRLAAQHGRPEEAIAGFVAQIETDPVYWEWVGLSPLGERQPATPVSVPTPPRRAPIGPYNVTRSERCIHCGRCVQVCPYGVHARRDDDPRHMALPISHRCTGCLRCVQECPVRALVVAESSTYAALGRGVYTPGAVMSLLRQASGAVSSHCVPDEVDPSVTLGRRLERLPPDDLSAMPPVVEMALPFLLSLPSDAPPELAGPLLEAAQTLGILARVAEDHASAARSWTADRLEAAAPEAGLLVVEGLADVLPHLRTRWPHLVLAAEMALDHRAPEAALAWVSAGLDVLVLSGDDGLEGEAGVLDALSKVHHRLIGAARRDRLSLVVRGAVASPAYAVQALCRGADAVVIDWPLLVALGCRLQDTCPQGEHICGIETVDPDWAAARLVNLVRAWECALRDALAARGFRRAHHLRDACDDSVTGLEGLRRLAEADLAPVQLLGR